MSYGFSIKAFESHYTEKAIAEVFNKFFINIVPNLKIPVENNIDHDMTLLKRMI